MDSVQADLYTRQVPTSGLALARTAKHRKSLVKSVLLKARSLIQSCSQRVIETMHSSKKSIQSLVSESHAMLCVHHSCLACYEGANHAVHTFISTVTNDHGNKPAIMKRQKVAVLSQTLGSCTCHSSIRVLCRVKLMPQLPSRK